MVPKPDNLASSEYETASYVNPYSAKVIYLYFQPLEVVSRYRDPQHQVVENWLYLFNLRPNIYNC